MISGKIFQNKNMILGNSFVQTVPLGLPEGLGLGFWWGVSPVFLDLNRQAHFFRYRPTSGPLVLILKIFQKNMTFSC